MKTILCKNESDWIETAASLVREKIADGCVLALACGQTMRPLWEKLAGLCRQGELSFRNARILCVTELSGVPEEKSCRYALTKGLLEKTDVRPENCHFPNPDAPEDYDKLIESLGGIDLAVLGLGENCHIGYNEPGTLFDSHTHIQKLTDRTKSQLLKRGFSEADMPAAAVTMGIRTITEARDILLLARGADKAGAVYQTLYARTTSYIPSAFLQIPLNVTAVLDEDAGREL